MFEFSHFCLPSLILGVLSVFWILAILVGSDISLCFDLHFYNDEHLFKCSLAISISLVICLFSLSPIFKLNHLPYSPLSLNMGYLFLLCSNINGCSATSYDFGVLAGKDACTSFYSAR